jgi:hypothetical protein
MKKRVAFDLDETIAVALVDSKSLLGFTVRQGSADLLNELLPIFDLVLWSSSPRSYVDRALSSHFGVYFKESYSWDEMPCRWKDVRMAKVDYLVDDSDHHFVEARKCNIGPQYIVVPAFGTPEDAVDPLAWTRIVRRRLLAAGGTP